MNSFSKVYQTTIAILFLGSIIGICAAMLLIQILIVECSCSYGFLSKFGTNSLNHFQLSNGINTIVLLESMLYGFWAFCMVFFACELGQRFTDTYEEIGSLINRLDWYLFPMEIQRMLPTLMVNTQQPFEILCFGSSTCSHETLKMVSPNE